MHILCYTGVLVDACRPYDLLVQQAQMKVIGMNRDRQAPTFCSSQPLLLHLKHALDDKRWPHSLHDESNGKGKGGRHAKDLYNEASIKEGFNDARHQKKPSCNPAYPLEDLQVRSSACGAAVMLLAVTQYYSRGKSSSIAQPFLWVARQADPWLSTTTSAEC